jgi:hypothetical protein
MSASKHGIQVLKKAASQRAVNTNWDVGKFKNQLPSIRADAGGIERTLRKIDYEGANYCKFGLLHHDMLQEVDPCVAKARKRMTDGGHQARLCRIARAQLLSANQQYLPPDQWTPMDSDHNYLDDHISNVKNEEHERKLMQAALLDFDSYTDRLFAIPFRVQYYMQIQKLRATLNKQFHVENPLI